MPITKRTKLNMQLQDQLKNKYIYLKLQDMNYINCPGIDTYGLPYVPDLETQIKGDQTYMFCSWL